MERRLVRGSGDVGPSFSLNKHLNALNNHLLVNYLFRLNDDSNGLNND